MGPTLETVETEGCEGEVPGVVGLWSGLDRGSDCTDKDERHKCPGYILVCGPDPLRSLLQGALCSLEGGTLTVR